MLKQSKRIISLILCAAILIGILPHGVRAVTNDDGSCTIRLYQLVNAPVAGGKYLILSSNSAGNNIRALSKNSSGTGITNQNVTVKAADSTSNVVYVDNIGSATVWTAESGWKFKNNSNYLAYSNTLTTTNSGSSWNYNTQTNTLSCSVTTSNWWGGSSTTTYYLRYSNGWTTNTNANNASPVYFYKEAAQADTYRLEASGAKVELNHTLDLSSITKTLKLNDSDLTTDLGGSYSYSIVSGNQYVSLNGSTLTANSAGIATIKVTYTWNGNQVWDEITIQSGDIDFELDIRDGTESKDVIPIKNVKYGDTKQLSAVVYYNDTYINSPTITWSSSDTTIATVDSSTGLVTLTGKEGTAVITATYTNGDDDPVADQVTITATPTSYILPSDGTNDFPEYPNEGSIRFDKTGSAVGNFNDTGLAQVELSMTGVPYGFDVIVMLDMSSSMNRCIHCNNKKGEGCNCGNNFKSRLNELNDALKELQSVLQSSEHSSEIRIAVADFNGTQDFGPSQYNDANNHVDRTQDVGALTNGGQQKVYTSIEKGSHAGTRVDSNQARRTLLSANAFIPVKDLDVNAFNFTDQTPKTGTNYDYAFDAVYQLGYAIKQQNKAQNKEYRQLFVIFMSDGASNQFNYYNTTGGQGGTPGTSDWDAWLTGSIDGNFSEYIQCTEHSYYYDADTGNQHRMANAIKGDPNQTYEIIRKNQNLAQGPNQGSNDAVTSLLTSAGKDNLYMIPGLGATTYTLAFFVPNDGKISKDSAKHSLRATASSAENYIEAETQGAMGAAFRHIATQIVEAAKDVVVTDQMAKEYSMVFESPNGTTTSALDKNGDGKSDQEFYIEILKYKLDSTTNERTGNGTSLLKLYLDKDYLMDGNNYVIDEQLQEELKQLNAKLKEKDPNHTEVTLTNEELRVQNYYAASDANGTAFQAPVFEATPLGSMFYWTTTDITASPTYTGVSVKVGNTTYYFDSTGKKQDAADNTWYNMTSGAYASGTVKKHLHELIHDDDFGYSIYSEDLIIATPYFVYNAGMFNDRDKMLYWTLDKISRDEMVMRYFLYLETSAGYNGELDQEPGPYPTNRSAELTYSNFQNNVVQQKFPKPQLTWDGAQMSYVFYLVNKQGEPVNRAGQVVPFSEAVYVTDVYTKHVTWSDGADRHDAFQADTLAKNIVPSVYSLYDPGAFYNVHVYAKNTLDGENNTQIPVDNHFEIGTESNGTNYPIPNNPNTTYVFNSKSDIDKYNEPGAYAQTDVEDKGNQAKCIFCDDGYLSINHYSEAGFDYYDTVVAFAVTWDPYLKEDEVVIDYGLDVVVNVTFNDMGDVKPVGLLMSAPKNGSAEVKINTGTINGFDVSSATTSLDIIDSAHGQKVATASIEGSNIRFRLERETGMQLRQAYKFYYVASVSFYDDHDDLVTNYMYSSLTVTPATTMYYEEDFVTSYSNGDWSLRSDSTTSQLIQDVDRPGIINVSADYDADNVYGYDSHYEKCTEYSQGTALKTSVRVPANGRTGGSSENTITVETIADGENNTGDVTEIQYQPGPTASFTFYGTGFDLIGRTDDTTACILVTMKKSTGDAVEFRPYATGPFVTEVETKPEESTEIETQEDTEDETKPTVTVTRKEFEYVENPTDPEGEKLKVVDTTIFVDTYYEGVEGQSSAITQVPVVTVRDLQPDTYTVTIEVIKSISGGVFEHPGATDFYIDAVRIYDPTGAVGLADLSKNYIAQVYELDNELFPHYEEFGNEILKVYGYGAFAGATFVDREGNEIDAEEFETNGEQYASWGPNNELYMSSGTTINLTVDSTYLRNKITNMQNSAGMADMQLGMKLVSGTSATIQVSSSNGKSAQYTLTSGSDLNFSIKDFYNGTLSIENLSTGGGGIVALTTMKVTFLPPATSTSYSTRQPNDSNAADLPSSANTGTSAADVPTAPNGIIAAIVLGFKETFAAVIIAVANAMDAFSRWLQDVAKALFSGGV